MSLANPFCTTAGYNQHLEGNRIRTGFGSSLNNFSPSQQGDANIGANGAAFPYDVYGLRPHISLIFVFEQSAKVRRIDGSCFRGQVGAGAGAERTSGTTRLFCRIVGLRGVAKNMDTLVRTIFDPLQLDKDDPIIRANVAALTGINYEVAAAWDGNPVGRVFKWASADIFYDKIITRDENFTYDVDLQPGEGDVILMTPAYSDRDFYDTGTGLMPSVFVYAGSPPGVGGGTDYRNFPVLRTFSLSGETC